MDQMYEGRIKKDRDSKMITSISLQVTLFSMIVLGYFLRKRTIVSEIGQKELTDLVLYIILPANIISSFIGDYGRETLVSCFAILIISVCIQIFSVILGRILFRTESEKRRISLRYALICSNAGFLGNPISEGVYGVLGLMYASVFLLPLRIMMWSKGISMYSGDSERRTVIRKVVTHPCVIACAVGVVILVCNLRVPEMIVTPVNTIGKCNTAISMMVIGMILANADIRTLFDRTVVLYSFIRLFLMPASVLVLLLAIGRLTPVNMDRTVLGISVLLTAMPAGATTSMLAEKYDCDSEFAAKLTVGSTLISVFSIIFWMGFLNWAL